MIIEGPLGELDLCDRLRLEPDTVYDFFLRKCPLSSFSLLEIGEGACLRFQIFQSSPNLAADVRQNPFLILAAKEVDGYHRTRLLPHRGRFRACIRE